jgi:hypothetical protein
MTINKIISGGQTGADQAALDAAIKLGIPYGGWIPKGRKTENGPLPDKYQLVEMPTANDPKRTKKNIVESDGTLILSHGDLSGDPVLTKENAEGLGRPCFVIDFNTINTFQAAMKVVNWIRENGIRILNVTGPRASKDPRIYKATMDLISSIYHLDKIHDNMPDLGKPPYVPPRTVEEAIKNLLDELSLKDRAHIANMAEIELNSLNVYLGQYIRNNFRLLTGNDSLLESCRLISGEPEIHADRASQIIIDELWKKLTKTHKLRLVK